MTNLSKIKTKFRTEGQITGNWGKPKVRTNGNSELGYTVKESISVPKPRVNISRECMRY